MTQDEKALTARDREAYGWKLDAISSAQHEKIAASRAHSIAAAEKLHGVDVFGGVECHVEGHLKDGVLYITDQYEIIDAKGE
jgi:hypothetical protein